MKRWKTGIVASGLCLMLAAAALSAIDWNAARPYVARKITAWTGRSVEIKGDLQVRLSLWPRIIANDIAVGNAAWSSSRSMAEVKRLEFTISIPQLLIGRLSFPEISLSGFRVALEVNKDGAPNWIFGRTRKQTKLPHVGSLSIDNGTVTFRDPTADTDLSFVINTTAGGAGQDSRVDVKGKGSFRGLRSRFQMNGAGLLALRRADRPYPLKANLQVGLTRASIDGTLLDPLHLKKEKVNFVLQGHDLAHLYKITGVPFPPTPPYKLSGYLTRAKHVWTFERMEGTVGRSDLRGELSVDASGPRQLITAELDSRSLDLGDLRGFIGAGSGKKPRTRLLPTSPYNLEKIRSADADVRFTGEKIITENLPIEKMEAHLIIRDGVLELAPLNFGIAGGKLLTAITMDVRGQHIATHADITARGLHLAELFPPAKPTDFKQGMLGGRTTLDATGDSISQMMGTATGQAAMILDGGSISEMLLRMTNLDIANTLLLLVGGDREIPIRCMVANFNGNRGDFKVQDLLLDTPKVNITGDGNVLFSDESLHLKLVAQSKGFSLASLRGPVHITGTLLKPKFTPDTKKVALRGGAALGLAAATTGAAVLIPLLDFGDKKDSNCAALMEQTRLDAGIRQSDIRPKQEKAGRASIKKEEVKN